ncbi:MAG: ABC transporter substrate-binding protein [Syntrophobacterales bacterium]
MAQSQGHRRTFGVWGLFGSSSWYLLVFWLALILLGCGPAGPEKVTTLVLVGGSGPDELFAQKQLQAFEKLNPDIRVKYQSTPSSASERHTLYVTWLSSRSAEIDILVLDVVWIAEFASAGWLMPLDGYVAASAMPLEDFLPAGLASCTYQGRLYSLPWFADAGVLFYRKDLYEAAGLPPPRTFADLLAVPGLKERFGLPYGFIFPGQAYEGLVCVFLEFLWSNGGRLFDDKGRLVLDSPQNREALETLVNLIYQDGVSPLEVTTFMEEDCRHAFQQGYAVLMRNWPYAYSLMNQPDSPVRHKFALLPLVHGPHGQPTSCFGGANLGINAFSRHPEAAWKLVHFLLQPKSRKAATEALAMLPPLKSLYRDPELEIKFPYLKSLQEVFFTARSRPITPLYSLITDSLRIHASRALTRQELPAQALKKAEAEIASLQHRFSPPGGSP